MLSKCANPDCSASFHYYGQGRLFEVHFEDAGLMFKAAVDDEKASTKKSRTVEHFWLCSSCSQVMTIAMDRSQNVRILPLFEKRRSAAA